MSEESRSRLLELDDDLQNCPLGGPLRYENNTLSASVRFDVATPPIASRNYPWKFQVSPGTTNTGPVGVGMAPRSTGGENVPAAPEFMI